MKIPAIPADFPVTRCPPAYVAASTGTISAGDALAIRTHNDAREAAYQENGRGRKFIFFGKRQKESLKGRTGIGMGQGSSVFGAVDMMDDLPQGYCITE